MAEIRSFSNFLSKRERTGFCGSRFSRSEFPSFDWDKNQVVSTKIFLLMYRKLSEKDFDLDTKGKAQQKLMVLPFLHKLLYHNCMIGDFINSDVLIKSDYFVGDTKAALSVGFRSGKTVDMPVTLYKENVKKLIKCLSQSYLL